MNENTSSLSFFLGKISKRKGNKYLNPPQKYEHVDSFYLLTTPFSKEVVRSEQTDGMYKV